MSQRKPAARDTLELEAEDVLENLFDSDTWTPGLCESDPAEAARFIVDWIRSSGISIGGRDARKGIACRNDLPRALRAARRSRMMD